MLRYLVGSLLTGMGCALFTGSVLAAAGSVPSAGESAAGESAAAESAAADSAAEDVVREYSPQELRAWGIISNCIESHRIRNIRFRDDETAIIRINGGKRVLMTLERRCPGIRSRGFLHQTRINRLCASDSLRVIDTGSVCMIRDFTPFLEETADEDAMSVDSDLDSDHHTK